MADGEDGSALAPYPLAATHRGLPACKSARRETCCLSVTRTVRESHPFTRVTGTLLGTTCCDFRACQALPAAWGWWSRPGATTSGLAGALNVSAWRWRREIQSVACPRIASPRVSGAVCHNHGRRTTTQSCRSRPWVPGNCHRARPVTAPRSAVPVGPRYGFGRATGSCCAGLVRCVASVDGALG